MHLIVGPDLVNATDLLWGEKAKKKKKARRDLNPRLIELLLPRGALDRCASTTALSKKVGDVV